MDIPNSNAIYITLQRLTGLLILLSAHLVGPTSASEMEHKLYTKLLTDYDNRVRPVVNVTQTVEVKLGVILQQIIHMDEKNEQLTINAWLKYTWTDYRLAWEPTDYDGIADVRLHKGMLWAPDVLLYNSVDSTFDSTYGSNMVLYSAGVVNWIPPGIFIVSCKVDITWFPFDEQRCFLKFGSWTYDGTKLDLQPERNDEGEATMDMSEYMVSGEWNLYKTQAVRNEKFYDCCPEPYPSLYFYLNMRRRTLYYGVNLIVPCVLITLMCILGFALPSDGCQKITLQMTVLLSITVFLIMVSDMVPPTSEAVPLLGVFFSTTMFLVAASVTMTVAVLAVHHRSPDFNTMGPVARAILLSWIPWLLFMTRPGKTISRATLPNPIEQYLYKRKKAAGDGDDSLSSTAEVDERIAQCYRLLAAQKAALPDASTEATIVVLHMCYTQIRAITRRMIEADRMSDERNDWVFAANALDRLCLVVLTVLICGSTCFIFFSTPYLTGDEPA